MAQSRGPGVERLLLAATVTIAPDEGVAEPAGRGHGGVLGQGHRSLAVSSWSAQGGNAAPMTDECPNWLSPGNLRYLAEKLR